MENNKDNVLEYPKKKKKISINPAVVFFVIILIYLIIMLVKAFTHETLSVYEVKEGKIIDKAEYTGIILRDEKVYYASEAGYINYYNRENSKVAVNGLVYSVDKDGAFSELLENSIQKGDISLNKDDLNALKGKISTYMMNFDTDNFDSVYDINNSIKNELHYYINKKISFNAELSDEAEGIYNAYYSDISGLISYYTDGYEELTAKNIKLSDFSVGKYTKNSMMSGANVKLWDPIYKIINTDKWSVIVNANKEELDILSGLEQVEVKFKFNDIIAEADVEVNVGADGNAYAELKFDKYLTEFITDRFVDLEIYFQKTEGLKIPKSSVVNKAVLKIPVQYAVYGGNGQNLGFMKEITTEEGKSVSFVTGTIYKEDDFYYYIDCPDLALNDLIVKEGAEGDKYAVCMTEMLDGVYCVNKGYATFRRINILGEQDDYYIILKGIRKGLSVFDHIALDGSSISEDEIIY